jgi:solute carrier family 25 protein 34/35
MKIKVANLFEASGETRLTLTKDAIVNFLSGSILGAVGAFIGSPLFLVKCRMQSYTSDQALAKVVGDQYAYRNFLHGIKQIWRDGGLRPLFQGAQIAMLRTAVGSGIQLGCYDSIKRIFQEQKKFQSLRDDGIILHFTSSLIAGFFVCAGMNPFDVIMTRVYNQSARGQLLYTGAWDCFRQTIHSEGLGSLYRGFIPHYVRVG